MSLKNGEFERERECQSFSRSRAPAQQICEFREFHGFYGFFVDFVDSEDLGNCIFLKGCSVLSFIMTFKTSKFVWFFPTSGFLSVSHQFET